MTKAKDKGNVYSYSSNSIKRCSGFCKGGLETPEGLLAMNLVTSVTEKVQLRDKGSLTRQVRIFKRLEKHPRGFKCPLGFTHNPTSRQSTLNLVKNRGRHSICQMNRWKWLEK